MKKIEIVEANNSDKTNEKENPKVKIKEFQKYPPLRSSDF